jgi:hypothetical protein
MAMGITERLDTPEEGQRAAFYSAAAQTRVAIPGIIDSFDPVKQTASVQPAITENIQVGETDAKPTKLPLLTDVPVQFPRANGYCITLPVAKGDECLLVFADMCIDGWWQSGGVQDQMETRRHDLSDAIAIPGITSQPLKVKNYSHDKLQIRTDDSSLVVELDKIGQAVSITAPTVKINGNLTVSGEATIGGTAFTPHGHSYSWTDGSGSGNTGAPN